MIQQENKVSIADNSGAKSAQCIRVLGRSGARGKYTRAIASVGGYYMRGHKKVAAYLSA